MSEEKKVSRRKYIAYAGAGVVIVAGAAAGAYYATRKPAPSPTPTPTPTPTMPTTPTAKPTPTPTPTKLPYEGITLVQQACAEPLAVPFKMAAEEFKKRTGATIIIEEVAYGHVHDKVMTEAIGGTGAYDLVHMNPVWASDVVLGGYALPVDQYIDVNSEEWLDIIPAFREYVKWGGKIYGWPMDGDTHALYYRKDLFEHPDEKEEFKKRYGYELRVPETWDEYLDAAEFFTRKKGETLAGKKLEEDFWGTGGNFRREQVHWWFFARYFGLGGKYYFDPETMEPAFTSEAGVRALEIMLKEADPKRSPPGVLSWGFTELFSGFYTGIIAMSSANIWPDMAPMSEDPTKSKIRGKWGISHVPGTYEVWNYEEKKWEKTDKLFVRTPVPHNWMVLIMKTCKHPDVAAEWAKFLTGKEFSRRYVVGPWGADPFRHSHFTDPELRQRFPGADVYLDTLMANLNMNPWVDLRIPGVPEYYDALAVELTQALAKEKSPRDALNSAASKWNEITDRLGREIQKKNYRASLGLPT